MSLFSLEHEGGVATLTLTSPANRNALSMAMIGALQGAFENLGADRKVRAIVLAAEGPAFSAGHDLKEITAHRADGDAGKAYVDALMGACSKLMLTLTDLPIPVIAAVEGIATAAGCQLVATCDLAFAGAGARFQTPGVTIGLFCSTPMVALSRAVGRKAAMAMLLSGDAIDATTARDWGLISHLVPNGNALAQAQAFARGIAGRSRRTIATGKKAFYRQADMPLAEAYAHASTVMADNMLRADAEEGICAFLEKRAADWKD